MVSDLKTKSSMDSVLQVVVVGKTICHCFTFDNIILNWYYVCFSQSRTVYVYIYTLMDLSLLTLTMSLTS